MWILHFLPDSFIQFIVHVILLAGIVGCVLSFFVINKVLRFFPPFANYYKIAQVVSVVLLVAGIYFEGGYATEMQWRARVAELEAKVAISEQQSKDANEALDKKTKEKVKVVKQIQVVIKERIVKQAAKMDATCTVDSAAVSILNDAAKLRKGTVTVSAPETVK